MFPTASAAVILLFSAANKTPGAAPNRPGTAVRVYGDDSSECGVTASAVPYCSMAHAQLCFHGHRNAVKFFVTVPGECFGYTALFKMICYLTSRTEPVVLLWTGRALPPPGTTDSGSDDPPSESSDTASADPKTFLVMSGGEGYIDFRLGECVTPRPATSSPGERSAVPTWQPPDSSSSSSGDEGGELDGLSEPTAGQQPAPATDERSHLIVWQVSTSHD